MADFMLGTWKFTTTDDNFEKYTKEVGVGFAQRKIAAQAKPDLTITKSDDGKWTITTTTSFHKSSFSFKLGEPFMHDTIDGKKAMTVLTLDGNTLTMKEEATGDRKENIVIRVFEGDKLRAKFMCNGAVSERVYTKVN